MNSLTSFTPSPILVVYLFETLWSRVEIQAAQYMPWIALGRRSANETEEKQAARTILLDYPSMNIFQLLSTAVRYRHMLVVSSTLGTILLRCEIVLSTALFYVDIHADGTKTLTMRSGVVHAAVGVFCVLGLLVCSMLYHAPSAKTSVTPRIPSTLAGTAALLANSRHFLSKLSGTGTANMETVAAKAGGSWYTSVLHQPGKQHDQVFQLKQLHQGPMFMGDKMASPDEGVAVPPSGYSPWIMGRAVLYVVMVLMVVLIAALWAVFLAAKSGFESEAAHGYFPWTCLATLALVLLGSLVGQMDASIRRLTPLMKLASRACDFKEGLGLTYVDESAPRTLYKSLRNRDWEVSTKKALAILGSILPIFTAGLLANAELHLVRRLELRHETQFRTDSAAASSLKSDPALVEDVLLAKAPKYPSWAYETLAFPVLELVDLGGGEWPSEGTFVVATVPTLTASLTCEMVTVDEEVDCEPLDSNFNHTSCQDGQSYIGFVASSCSKPETKPTDLIYVWGSCADGDDAFMTMLKCTEEILQVDVRTRFRTNDLTFDANAIPVPDRASETPAANVSLGLDGVYDVLSNSDNDSNLDDFFATLVASRLDVPAARLASQERTNAISQAIQLQHGILRAQTLNSDAVRKPLTGSSSSPSPISASVDYSVARLRQATTQTVVLTVLLGLMLLLLLLTAVGLHKPCSLPKNPGSIAAQASLLADSTIWWRLPHGAEWLSDEKLRRRSRLWRKTFTMAWFSAGGGGGGRHGIARRSYSVGIVQDEGKVVRVELEAAPLEFKE